MISDSYHYNIELKHLRSFREIARRLSFRKAAAELHIAQPALSRHIAQLEQALDCQLFNRDKQRIRLTTAGDYLFAQLPALFDQLQTIADQTARIAAGRTVTLRLGYAAAAMSSFLPAVIRELHKSLDYCEFDFAEATSDRLIEQVLAGQLDTAFLLYRPDNPLLETVPIRAERTGLILPDDHPLARRRQIALADLKDETLILFPRQRNPVMYDDIIGWCQQAGFSPGAVREVTPRSIAIGLVAAGAGVATIAESLQHTCISGTTYRPLKQPGPMIEFSCISRRGQEGEWWTQLQAILRRRLGTD